MEVEERLERERAEAARKAREAVEAAAAAASNLTEGSSPADPLPDETSELNHAEAGVHDEGPAQPDAESAEGAVAEHAGTPGHGAEELDTEPPHAADEAAPAAIDSSGHGPAEDGTQPAEGSADESEESAEERGKRIAAQWTHDPEAVGEVAEVCLGFIVQAFTLVCGMQSCAYVSLEGSPARLLDARARSKRPRLPARLMKVRQLPLQNSNQVLSSKVSQPLYFSVSVMVYGGGVSW